MILVGGVDVYHGADGGGSGGSGVGRSIRQNVMILSQRCEKNVERKL